MVALVGWGGKPILIQGEKIWWDFNLTHILNYQLMIAFIIFFVMPCFSHAILDTLNNLNSMMK